MDTNKAAYWIALGVLALGLNSAYRNGSFVTLHQAADRAGSVICRISARAEQVVAVATGLSPRSAIVPDSLLAAADRGEMAREQAEMIREQALVQAELVREQVRNEILARRDVLRAQADVRRAEMEQLRWRVRSDLRLANVSGGRLAVLCPKTGKRVMITESDTDDDAPDVEVSETY